MPVNILNAQLSIQCILNDFNDSLRKGTEGSNHLPRERKYKGTRDHITCDHVSEQMGSGLPVSAQMGSGIPSWVLEMASHA